MLNIKRVGLRMILRNMRPQITMNYGCIVQLLVIVEREKHFSK
jgi:hypothetical protein